MAVELPKPDTKAELLMLAVVERLDALLAALAPAPEPTPDPAPARKRTPKQPPKEA